MGDMTLQGDTYQYFPQAPAPAVAQPAATPVVPVTAKQSWLVPAMAAAALGLGGLGTGVGLSSLFSGQAVTQPTQQAQADADRDWKVSAYVTAPDAP